VGGALREQRPGARPLWALTLANVRFWPTVWPLARRQLRRWEQQALSMPAGAERELALAKLAEESFNAEVAATLATLAPLHSRAHVVEAIVALEVLFDYLDGVSEQPSGDPLQHGAETFAVFLAAVGDRRAGNVMEGRNDYARELAGAVRAATGRLAHWELLEGLTAETAHRCAQAQTRIHAVPVLGVQQAREWANGVGSVTGLGWRETLAGSASSVLALHALIAAAADPRSTLADARATASLYLPIAATITLLDSIVDHASDLAADAAGFISLYEEPRAIGGTLEELVRDAAARAPGVRDGAHHLMTLAGAVAYWTTDPQAGSLATPEMFSRLRRELSPVIWPALGVMRMWRAAKRARSIL
jgi:hypothetical protein